MTEWLYGVLSLFFILESQGSQEKSSGGVLCPLRCGLRAFMQEYAVLHRPFGMGGIGPMVAGGFGVALGFLMSY